MNKLNALKRILTLTTKKPPSWIDEAEAEFGKDPISEDEWAKKITPIDNKFYVDDTGSNYFFNMLKQRLLTRGIVLLKQIGKGANGIVFEASFNGKPTICKAIMSYRITTESNDVENITKIYGNIKSFPKFVRDCFPEIYFTDTFKIRDVRKMNKGQNDDATVICQVICMEKMAPLSEELYRMLKSGAELESDDFYFFANNLYEKLKDELSFYKNNTLPEVLALFDLKKIYNKKNWSSSFELARNICNVDENFSIVQNLRDYDFNQNLSEKEIEQKQNLLNEMIVNYKNIKNDVFHICADFFEDIAYRRKFDKHEHVATPETQKIKDAHNWLKQHGIIIRDMHPRNFMLSQSGSIKFSDLGWVDLKEMSEFFDE